MEKPETVANFFPNPLATSETKLTYEYGLNYARAIWTNYNQNIAIYSEQKRRWIINRKYAEGMQSVDKYKDRMDIGDTSWMNLDLTPVTVIPKFVDNIVGLLSNQTYKIQCEVLNSTSKTKEDTIRNKLYANMLLKPISDQISSTTGVPLVPPSEFVPADDEELNIYMQQNFKDSDALAMQLAIKYVLGESMFSDIEKQVLRDLVNLKIAAINRYYDKNKNICVEYVDPVDLIVPYSKYDDFRNIPWTGVMKKYTIQEISCMTDEFSEEDLFEIARLQAGNNSNQTWTFGTSYEGYYSVTGGTSGRKYDNFYISVLDFEFIGVDEIKYEKKNNKYGGAWFSKKDSTYETPKDAKYKREVLTKNIDNRYEGKWIVGSDKHLFNYKKANNVPREKVDGNYSGKTNLQTKVIAPNIYDMQNKSLTERMIPYADQLELINLKIQQLLIKMTPAGVYIDQDAIENVMRGLGGGAMTPKEVLQMYYQTGSMVGRSRREDGSIINGKPIEVLPGGVPPGFETLNSMWESEIGKIYAVIGYNPATDGSEASASALVGVQKLQIQSTNNSLRPLNDSYIKLVQMVAKDLGLMIQDKIEYGGGMEGFERAIGKESIEVIKSAKGLPLCEFGISVVYAPDEAERMQTNQDIQLALENKLINLVDAIEIRKTLKADVNLAIQVLIYKQKQRERREDEVVKNNSEANSQQQQQSAQVAGQVQEQVIMTESKSKADLLKLEYDLKERNAFEEHKRRMEELLLVNDGKLNMVKVQHDSQILHAAFDNAISPPTSAPQ